MDARLRSTVHLVYTGVTHAHRGCGILCHKLADHVVRGVNSLENDKCSSGLDWTVNTHPAYAMVNGKMIEVPNTNVVVRDQDSKTLGVVSDKYKIVNNIEVAE